MLLESVEVRSALSVINTASALYSVTYVLTLQAPRQSVSIFSDVSQNKLTSTASPIVCSTDSCQCTERRPSAVSLAQAGRFGLGPEHAC